MEEIDLEIEGLRNRLFSYEDTDLTIAIQDLLLIVRSQQDQIRLLKERLEQHGI